MNAQLIPFPDRRKALSEAPYVLEHVESGQELAEADSMDEAREKAANLYRGLGLRRVVVRARWSGAVTELVMM